jgi:hypothetical protein
MIKSNAAPVIRATSSRGDVYPQFDPAGCMGPIHRTLLLHPVASRSILLPESSPLIVLKSIRPPDPAILRPCIAPRLRPTRR